MALTSDETQQHIYEDIDLRAPPKLAPSGVYTKVSSLLLFVIYAQSCTLFGSHIIPLNHTFLFNNITFSSSVYLLNKSTLF